MLVTAEEYGRNDSAPLPVAESGPFHRLLREATRPDHEAVDAAFGTFQFGEAADYGRFLTAHARVLPAIEIAIAPAEMIAGWNGRTDALRADLAALGCAWPAAAAIPALESAAARWGALYVIEGSRLGGAMLARQVPDHLPSAYLSATHGSGGWKRILHAIDAAAAGQPAEWHATAIGAARATFAAYRAAANG